MSEDGDEMKTTAYFTTPYQDLDDVTDMDIGRLRDDVQQQVENWSSRGSGFILDKILSFTVCICVYHPLTGSTYIKTPKWLADKRAVINVRNQDNKCFVWAVLSAIIQPIRNSDRVNWYEPHLSSLNLTGLSFPTPVKQIPIFEKNNPDYSVNVLYRDDDDNDYSVLYLSPNKNRPHHINLLLLEAQDKNGDEYYHYVWIKNMSRLVGDRTKHEHQSFVCNSCLQPFRTQRVLDNHSRLCERYPPQQIDFPNPKDEKESHVMFRSHKRHFYLPFYIVCDFESFLEPHQDVSSQDGQTKVIDVHHASGFGMYRVTHIDEYMTEPIVYSGENVVDKFYDCLMDECRAIEDIVRNPRKMKTMTNEQLFAYHNATKCGACGADFIDRDLLYKKVRHHDHVSGDFLFAACSRCNLQMKFSRITQKTKKNGQRPDVDETEDMKCDDRWLDDNGGRKRRIDEEDETRTNERRNKTRRTDYDDDEDDDEESRDEEEEDYGVTFFLPVILHNLRGYDSHIILKEFHRRYTARKDKRQSKDKKGESKYVYGNIEVIPQTTEKFISFKIGNMTFLDSFQFLSASLDNLVSLLYASGGKDKFVHTRRHFGDDDIVFSKGIYPYSYMTGRDKFSETKLPPIDEFYDKLSCEPLDPKDYAIAVQTWHKFGIQNLQQYHDHYLKLDILLLADVFQNFRDLIYTEHKLDCLHYLTLPSLSWDMALKHTNIKLDLITDPDMYLMVESAMRGGISIISHRHAIANNPYVEGGYDLSKPTSYLVYLDANNLYGAAMSEPLPCGKFRFLSNEEMARLDIMNHTANDPVGYILEVDLVYPDALHDRHNDYPLCPDHLMITDDMLSDYSRSFPNRPKPTTKLVPNLLPKTKYVVHYRNLQYYIQQGIVLKKIHRVLSFSQRPWLRKYIELCTKKRQDAKSQFEMDTWKLCANAIYGKSMQNKRKQMNVRLIADPPKLRKALAKPHLMSSKIINDELVMVHGGRRRVQLNKPIYVGFAILDISKLIMYKFHYDFIIPKYGQAAKLCFTDTDSLTYHIQTNDLYADMGTHSELFDLSNFDKSHPQYSDQNRKVVGKMKSETGSCAPKEFVGLRSKMYSLHVGQGQNPKITAKGIKKSYVKKNVKHNQFLQALQSKVCSKATFCNIRSSNHVLQTLEMTKVCLNAYDDKRYILDDGVNTLAFGHHMIRGHLQ